MKKFLSCFLSLILLTNITFISCAFAKNDSSVKIEKTKSITENSEKNNKISDEDLKKKIINLMKTGEVNVPHKTTLDVLYMTLSKILNIPIFLLKAALITAGSLISITLITGLTFFIVSLNKFTKITADLKDSTENIKDKTLNINVSDAAACTMITTVLIPIYEILNIPLPNKDKYVDFCFNLTKKEAVSEFYQTSTNDS